VVQILSPEVAVDVDASFLVGDKVGRLLREPTLFVREHGPRAAEMYRASGSLKLGALYFPYALAAGYLSEWRTLLGLL